MLPSGGGRRQREEQRQLVETRQDQVTDLTARDGQRNYWRDRQAPCPDAQQQQQQAEPGTLVAN